MDEWRGRVEDALREAVRSDDAYLTEVASHLIVAGGKRVRPLFAIASAASPPEPLAVTLRATKWCEAGWPWSWCTSVRSNHDDVIDEAPTRRTVESVNARWGNLTAILAGDFLLARASELAHRSAPRWPACSPPRSAGSVRVKSGELRAAYERGPHRAAYFSAIEGKTASLFATACRIGAIVGGCPAIRSSRSRSSVWRTAWRSRSSTTCST